MKTEFTLEGYRTLLGALLERGYEARGFDTVKAASPHIILRHDLDMSLEAALPLSRIEAELGVRRVISYYWVQSFITRCPQRVWKACGA